MIYVNRIFGSERLRMFLLFSKIVAKNVACGRIFSSENQIWVSGFFKWNQRVCFRKPKKRLINCRLDLAFSILKKRQRRWSSIIYFVFKKGCSCYFLKILQANYFLKILKMCLCFLQCLDCSFPFFKDIKLSSIELNRIYSKFCSSSHQMCR